jgi:hypothetical protein
MPALAYINHTDDLGGGGVICRSRLMERGASVETKIRCGWRTLIGEDGRRCGSPSPP